MMNQSEKFDRKQMGFLKFNERSYIIYEGLNVIGRDLKATVRVNDLKFSKQHAVLSVVNHDTHFISDFSSANGTYIKNETLIPFKFYKINDKEEITFGDVLGVYYVQNPDRSQRDNEVSTTQSQTIDHVSSTQLMNVHELKTQEFISDKTKLIQEAPTQVLIPVNKQLQNTLDISSSELYDDVLANSRFQLHDSSKYDIVVDETLECDKSTINKENNNVSGLEDDDDIILSTQDDAMINKHASELGKICLKVEKNSELKPTETAEVTTSAKQATAQNENNDDSETDIEDEEDIVKKVQQKFTLCNDSKNNVSIINKESLKENTDDSGSETDAEDDLLAKNIIPKQTSSSLDTEIEDNIAANFPATKNNESTNKIKINLIEISDEEEELDLLAPTEKLQEASTIEKIQDEDVDLAPTQLLQNQNENQIEEDNDDDLLLVPTQILQKPAEEYDDDTDDELLAPTQLLQCPVSDHEKEVDDDDLVPTQLLQSKSYENKGVQDEDDLPPTQLLLSCNKNPAEKTFLAPTQLLAPNKQNDSIFSAPTQLLEKSSPFKKSSILSLKSPKNKEKRSVNFSEDVYEMSTQKLDESKEEDKEHDIFTAPTQLLENKSPRKKEKPSIHISEDVFDIATQKLIENKEEDNKIEKEHDVFTAPTQLLDENQLNKSKDPNDSDCSGFNMLNTTRESIENISLKLVLSETDNDSICENKNNSLNKLSESKSSTTTLNPKPIENIPETETQLEVDFALETQKLYVEEKTARPDNPLGHMFAEEPTQMTEEISHIETKHEKAAEVETNQRLMIKLENIQLQKSTEITTNKTKDRVAQNTPKLNITKVKNKKESEIQLKGTEKAKRAKKDKTSDHEPENESNVKSSETNIDRKTHNTRGKRISYQKLNSGKTGNKTLSAGNLLKGSSDEKKEEAKKIVQNDKLKTPQIDKNENSSNLDDFVRKVRRSKRAHSISETANKKPGKNEIIQEDDSDESFPPKKKVVKLQYTDDSDYTNASTSSIIIPVRKTKRNIQIDDYSSDENSKTIVVNTPKSKRKYAPLNISLGSQILTNSEETVKHKVIFTMINDAELENSAKILGATIVDSVHECTVLVTNKITRSLKFLLALALGKPIVQTTWINDSVKKNVLQDPWNYLLEDKESEIKFKFNLKDSLKKASEKKLLSDVTILIAAKKNYDVLKEIIETSGGKCISRAPAKHGKAIVVSYEDEKQKYSKYLKQKSLTVVSAEAIFSGILQQKLQWNDHILS